MRERTLDLPGAVNLRDFGGYETADGRRVRRRRLFRSGTLAHLAPEAQRALTEIGIELICDLRREEERQDEPTALPPERPRRLEIPIDPGSAVAMRAALAAGELPLAARIDYMVAINRDLVRDHVDDYARMFAGLLDLEGGGFLLHCSAGKDRTGFGCALILHALGVPEQVVLDDYLLTNTALDYEAYILPRMIARFGADALPDRESVLALAGVRPEYLAAAYAAIEAEFENVENYIARAIGLDAGARETLRRRLLEPATQT
jgi:protein-tyrosine phosphatase